MKNVALAAAYEHPAEMEKRLEEDRVTDALKDKQELQFSQNFRSSFFEIHKTFLMKSLTFF